MILLHKPGDTRLQRIVENLRTRELTYRAVGATLDGTLVARYRNDRYRIVLGSGDVVFERAVAALKRWTPQRGAGLRVFPADAPVAEGTISVLVQRMWPVHVVVPCRIVYVVDEADRFGFGYGTLPGHPETGEEGFLVERDADGVVVFRIVVFSRPATLLMLAGAPVVRHVQKAVTHRYLAVLKAASSPPASR
jgi:uncharacterized protein (UPF0548 family)